MYSIYMKTTQKHRIITHDMQGRKLSPSQSAVLTEMLTNLNTNMIKYSKEKKTPKKTA
jgi:hypothetical protein